MSEENVRRRDDILIEEFKGRLSAVEFSVSKLALVKEAEQRFLQDTLASMRTMIEKHDRIIIGDGEGMVSKIKVLQDADSDRKAHAAVLYAILAGLVVERIWHFFLSK